MIYTYKYLSHPIENFHKSLMFFFEKLFELNPDSYDESRLTEADFRLCVNDSRDVIKDGLIKIVELYYRLPSTEKDMLRQAYAINSDIERICRDITIDPVQYKKLPFLFEQIIKDGKTKEVCFLKDFSMKLWKKYPHVNRIETMYGVIQDHFNKFRTLDENRGKVCPFCGLFPLLPPTETSQEKNRDDYDHVAAESIYPFVALNFKNLAPACGACNTNEKKTEDVFYDKEKQRREVLYPYDETYRAEELNIKIENVTPYDPSTLKTLFNSIDWDFAIELAGVEESYLKTWDQVYHIKDRYKRALKTFEKEWFCQLVDIYKEEMEDGVSYDRFKEKVLKRSKKAIKASAGGMLRYVYYNYLLSLDSFKGYLEKE